MNKISYKVWILALGHLVVDIPSGALLIALPYFKNKFGLNFAQMCFLPMVFWITGSISQPIFGVLSDRKHQSIYMPLGCLISVIGFLMCIYVKNYYAVFLWIIFSGIGSSVFHPEGARCANYFSGKNTGKGIGLLTLGGFVGSALGSLIMGIFLSKKINLEFIFCLPSLLLFLPLLKAAKSMSKINLQYPKAIIGRKIVISLLMVLMVLFLRSFIISGVLAFLPMYLIAYRGQNESFGGLILALSQLSGMIGTYLGGVFTDKFSSRKVILWTTLPSTLLIFLFLNSSLYLSCFLIILNNSLMAAAWTSLIVISQKLMPNKIATASALTMGLSMGMGAGATILLGKIADCYDVTTVFIFLMWLPLMAFLFSWFIKEE